MDKLEYIPGDLVKFATNNYTIVNFEENFLHNKICYALISTNSTKTAFVADRDILPIPLTPEILEKNGWKKEAMSRGVRDRHLVYTKPDIEEYGYFPIYIEKVSVMSLMYIRLLTIMYVTQLHTLSMFISYSTFSSV